MFVETKKEGEAPAVKQGPSLAGLIAWLETKNPREHYDFDDCNGACLIGQYLNAIGMVWNKDRESPGRCWWREIQFSIWGDLSARTPHTFGAALKRARAYVG